MKFLEAREVVLLCVSWVPMKFLEVETLVAKKR